MQKLSQLFIEKELQAEVACFKIEVAKATGLCGSVWVCVSVCGSVWVWVSPGGAVWGCVGLCGSV